MNYIKLSEYARQRSMSYRRIWQLFKEGRIEGAHKSASGAILVQVQKDRAVEQKVVIYARVSSSENKANLDSQADRLYSYAVAKGYQVLEIVKEIGSGVNDSRKKVNKIFSDDVWDILLVEHKDRLTRFGFNYIDTLVTAQGRKIEVVNLAENDQTDLVQDLVSIIYSFSARLYGKRRGERKTEKLINCLKEIEEDASLI